MHCRYKRSSLTGALLAITAMALLALQTHAASNTSQPITIFAAASLADALQEVADNFSRASKQTTRLSFGASSALARQIEAGAQADVFFSADTEWMDYLQSRALVNPSTRRNVLGNSLVLITARDNPLQLKIAPHFPLAATIGRGWLATGDPDSVPVGRYARAALVSLGVWADVSQRIVRADNARAALIHVAQGDATVGIVYATDARAEKRVRIVDEFPNHTHQPIVYSMAVTSNPNPAAKEFSTYVLSKAASVVFEKNGFIAISKVN